jgi:hypothetical protein
VIALAVARYLLAEHLRSRRFVAPFLLLAAGVVVLYAQPPNPVLSTAGVVAAFAFAAMCWAALAFLNTQGDADRHVLAAAAGPRAYLLGRMAALLGLAGTVTLAVVAFPLVTGTFERAPALGELAICLLGTFACALAGSALGALFAQPLIRSRAVAVLGLTSCAVVTVPLGVSPAVAAARALDVESAGTAATQLLPLLLGVALFALAVGATCAWLWRVRE